jgi:hypothetical protein
MRVASAKKPGRTHYPEDFWNIQMMGASMDVLFAVAHSVRLCRKILYKYVLGADVHTRCVCLLE